LAGRRVDRLRPDDLDEVVSLEARCFPTPWSKAALAGAMVCPRTTLLSIRAADGLTAILGYMSFRVIAPEVEIFRIAVDLDHRRRGGGSALMSEGLRRAAIAGARTIFLEVRAKDNGAMDFYQTFGFAPVGQRGGYYGASGEDARILTRTL